MVKSKAILSRFFYLSFMAMGLTDFSLAQYFFAVPFLVGLLGVVLVLSGRVGKKRKPLALVLSIALVAAGVLGSIFFAPQNLSYAFQSTSSDYGYAGPVPIEQASAAELDLSNARLISEQTQVFTQTLQPLVCDQGNLVYWRELKVYNVTWGNTTKTYSTITLFVKNVGGTPVNNIFIKEKLPEKVAKTPDELVGFSVTPFAFEEGSVVVDFLFNNIQPQETKQVSYTVEKPLDPQVLNEYEPPKTVSANAADAPAPTKQGFDFALIGLVAVAVVLGAIIVLFLRRN